MKSAIFALFLILITIFSTTQAIAQSDEEMAILHMFYKEKDLVESATRNPKPVSQVAENITVITAQEIRNMNAHTVADVLNRIPGLFINFTQDFGASSLLQIEGSESRHVLVLLDGIPWNTLASGSAETNTIPVGIVERIEVVKGPGSSAWGSSLGGVVNIITKGVGTTDKPSGSIRASYGERNTQDYRAGISGKAGTLGYYLFGSRQESDGLRSPRDFDTYNLYSKFALPISSKIKAQVTVGYGEPDQTIGEWPLADASQDGNTRTFFGTASLDVSLTKELIAKVAFHHFTQRLGQRTELMGLGFYGEQTPELLQNTVYDEETNGGRGKLIWEGGMQTAVLGVDVDYGRLTEKLSAGPFLQSVYEYPPVSKARAHINRWAIYANDTIIINRFSITPGVRYDDNNITGSFVSPSLGITYQFQKDSVLRASVARGFAAPGLAWTSGGALFISPNPSLDSERVWSCQGGLETAAFRYFWVKGTFFYHELSDYQTLSRGGAGPPTYNDLIVNDGKVKQLGGEIEAQTMSFHNFSLFGGFSYVHCNQPGLTLYRYRYMLTPGLVYDDQRSFRAELFGRYLWWGVPPPSDGKYDDFICDLNLNKKIYSKNDLSSELFFTAHNLFNGSQYGGTVNQNPRRWVEAGIRVEF